MSYQSYSPSFSSIPKVLKWILISMGAMTLLIPQIPSLFGLVSPYTLLGASAWGLKHGMIWQLLTFAFLSPPSGGISFSLLISLFFNLYILYFVSLSILTTRGTKDFLYLFFGGILFTGLIVAVALLVTTSPHVYCSSSTAIFLMLTAWMMMDPERQILLFMVIPVKIKWLVLIFFGGQIFVEFANGHLIDFAGLLTPCIYAWLFALLKWEIKSPFAFMNKFEEKLLRAKKRYSKHFQRPRSNVDYAKASKIFDFQSGEAILDDDSFMDICLAKISREGKSALSLRERLRMRRISKKRSKKG